MITSEKEKPISDGSFIMESIVEWERTLDPWHEDAFPIDLKFAGVAGKRKWGWIGYDWAGNPLVFIPDGTEINVKA